MLKLSLGIVGTGVVGKGVIDLLRKNGSMLQRRSGVQINIHTLCSRSIQKKANENWAKKYKTTADFKDVIEDPEIDVIVELIGGTSTALKVVEGALKNGKHVVTANKALLSKHGKRLFELAIKRSVELFYEAAVGGGIPIMKVLRESLAGNRVESIYCIINGTTNFILTQMIDQGTDFQKALKDAQIKGFAEADPTLDINGADAAQKTGLLAQLAFNTEVDAKKVHFEGIEKISLTDIQEAHALGYKVKLLGVARRVGSKEIDVRVHPTLVLEKSELASVNNEYNAVLVQSDFLGDSLYYGKGAGAKPTASAVVSDLNDLAHNAIGENNFNAHQYRLFEKKTILPVSEVESKYYVRLFAQEKPGVLASIATVFAKHHISIQELSQHDGEKSAYVPIVFITHAAKEKNMTRALEEIEKFRYVKSKPALIKIIEFS